MRAKDIIPGNRYMCRIGGTWRECIVTQAIVDIYGKPAYRVRRADMPLSGVQLKPRTARNIHPMPGSKLDAKEQARAAKAAARPKSPREPRPPHASQSFREYHAELRAFVADVDAWADRQGGPRADRRVVQRWIRSKLRSHLDNRMTWLSMTVLPASTTLCELRRAAVQYERRYATSRAACHVARMMGADPEVIQGLMNRDAFEHVKVGK